jgi:ferredoxin--NADP+ reductase
MKAVSDLTRPFNIRTFVSLNTIMVDGTGMCGGCRLTVDGEMKFACVDGPEFDGHSVDFEELMMRNKTYLGMEQEASRRYDHECALAEREKAS